MRRVGGATALIALVAVLCSSLLVLVVPAVVGPPTEPSGVLATAAVALAALLVGAVALRSTTRRTLPAVAAARLADREQARRGAFRRQRRPDAPGKPLARAPGAV